ELAIVLVLRSLARRIEAVPAGTAAERCDTCKSATSEPARPPSSAPAPQNNHRHRRHDRPERPATEDGFADTVDTRSIARHAPTCRPAKLSSATAAEGPPVSLHTGSGSDPPSKAIGRNYGSRP